MDKATAEFYQSHAKTIFERYESVESNVTQYIQSSFIPGASILDIGSGSGRDLRRMLALGYDAYGVEPCDELREQALAKSEELCPRLMPGALPNISSDRTYDGILCSAVFMHIPANEQLDALITIRSLLKQNGRLLISIPSARPDLDQDSRDKDGRLFEQIVPSKLKLLCARLGMECTAEYSNEDALGRIQHDWTTLLFQKKIALGRPLDRIESVLRNDRKTATYKLALIRAFCDFAEHDENGLSWHVDSKVSLPIARISEFWLLYYWPLVSSPQLIPQNNSIAGGGRPMAFRESLTKLIDLAQIFYDTNLSSTFSLFYMHWKQDRLSPEIKKQLHHCLTQIQSTIISGPIKYAEQGEMFEYNRQTKSVLIEADLWIEICLTGYWIKDSLLLRWAELCEQFSHKHFPLVTKTLVLQHLMTIPSIDRQQQLARKHYLKMPDIACVWSGKNITSKSLDVDHALPYSLRHNNQLWNLLPADKTVNRQKSDNIPSPKLLVQRKEVITGCWDYLFSNEQNAFKYEVERTLGSFNVKKWHDQLFNHLKSRAEQDIYFRGSKEWMPKKSNVDNNS